MKIKAQKPFGGIGSKSAFYLSTIFVCAFLILLINIKEGEREISMKKYLIISIAIVTLLIFSATITYAAKGGDPLQAVWDAIHSLQNAAASLQAQLTNSVASLQSQIDNIQHGKALHLYDANNQDLGAVAHTQLKDATLLYTTVFPTGGLFLQITDIQEQDVSNNVAPEAFLDNIQYIHFTGSDCSGVKLLENYLGGRKVIRSMVFKPAKHTYRYFKWNGEKTSGTSNYIAASKLGDFCFNVSTTTYMTNAFIMDEVSLPFNEPLAQPLEFREN